ncbi:hypothetical protein HMPREF0083_03421 [Aneurinibacillus aneurinilyticus ATCC 12856]|uniref:Uncharacterized protein n=1 Tax=Aneurinibacillus aneurinilyticus ATCC 12856 TaxID=649747 RepID=U1WIT6_ANEAE|nr:hypothetical protein HMPREF0083_03421 [Aneurinibacillus aneurinilyticus ATCC 12856]
MADGALFKKIIGSSENKKRRTKKRSFICLKSRLYKLPPLI